MKPMRASDAVLEKLKFPVLVQPKIDGVRALNFTGRLTGRSLKEHKNRYTTDFYSHPAYFGMDGEMAAASETDHSLCRITSSALSTITGNPFTIWWIFDYITEDTKYLGYYDRVLKVAHIIDQYAVNGINGEPSHLRIIPMTLCTNLEEVLALETKYLDEGYEGIIFRDPFGKHKEGYSTVREGGLLRLKRFTEEEAVVMRIVEGEENGNEAQTNELGNTFRSSHKANMIPNGLVGALICKNLKDQKEITVSPGRMTHKDRAFYFSTPQALLGAVIKYKHFDKGVKDKPRFPTFQCIRSPEDT